MELLIIPTVLAVGALLFNGSERKNERKIAEVRNKNEQEIAADRMREAALQTYIDKMTELLLDKGLRKSESDDEVRDVARTRTLTALRMLDPVRKGLLVRFLFEAKLITKDNPIIHLLYADLSKSNLSGANLLDANLTSAVLSEANLSGALLIGANLSGAQLFKANLANTILNDANLFGARLNGADMSGTHLAGTTMPDGTIHK